VLKIALLGVPRIERDGRPCRAPRGNKGWAILAYLLLSRRPPARRKLAELLFSEANDPLGALRWNLAQLRHTLRGRGTLGGDPLRLRLGPDVEIDVARLREPGLPQPDDLDSLTGELLEGMEFSASRAFEAWLAVERRHLGAAAQALVLERTQAELGAGRAEGAARLAARLLELDPLEEAHHELLVRSLVAAGDLDTALAQAAAGEELLERELGAPPQSQLREIVYAARASPSAGTFRDAAAVRGQLEAGEAAIGAGAMDTGLRALRSACAAADHCDDLDLQARAQLALGSALVHSMRAYGEAAVALHRAADAARRAGANAICATAHRELGFVDVQAGRRDRAEAWLAQAAEECLGSDRELASIASVRGMGLSDSGHYEEALECFGESIERAETCAWRRQIAWSQALAGRVHVLTGSDARAREVLGHSLELVAEETWIAVAPLPEALLAHVDLNASRLEAAEKALVHAFAIACQVGDPCWEGIACRGMGLVEAARGRGRQALEWLMDGRARCTRVAHPYQWIHGWVLDGMCGAAQQYGDRRLMGWIDALEGLASRAGMRELLLRAYMYRHRSGDRGARDAAGLLGAELDRHDTWEVPSE
jgi:DNA-binding SARP family transcriptional activator